MMRRFVKEAVIYALPMFLAKAVGLLLLPIYTRQLGPADFGFVEFVAAASVILLIVIPLEINQAVGRLLPEADEGRRQKIISTSLWFTTLMFLWFGGLVYLFRMPLLDLAGISRDFAQYAVLVSINLLVTAVVSLLQVQFRFTSQAWWSAAINLSVVLTNLILVLYFITTQNLGVEQYFLSQIVSGGIGVAIGFFILIKKQGRVWWSIEASLLRELLKYSLPIVASSIGVALAGSIDRIMVGSYVGLTELGYYGAAARFAAIFGLLFYCVSSAMTPLVYREYGRPETKILIARIFNATVWTVLSLLLLIILCGEQLVVLLAGEQYRAGGEFIFYLFFSNAIANLYIFFMGIDIRKQTVLLGQINLASGMAGSIGCLVLVPLFGVWGAVASMLLANTSRLASYAYFSQRVYPIPIKFAWALLLACGLFLMNVGLQMKGQ